MQPCVDTRQGSISPGSVQDQSRLRRCCCWKGAAAAAAAALAVWGVGGGKRKETRCGTRRREQCLLLRRTRESASTRGAGFIHLLVAVLPPRTRPLARQSFRVNRHHRRRARASQSAASLPTNQRCGPRAWSLSCLAFCLSPRTHNYCCVCRVASYTSALSTALSLSLPA